MKVEQLVPKGFQLIMYGNDRSTETEKIVTVVCNLVSDEAIAFSNSKAKEAVMKDNSLDNRDLDKIKIEALIPLYTEEHSLPEIVSPMHEEAYMNAIKIGFISRFIGRQLEIISNVQTKQNGLQSIHNPTENSEGKETNGKAPKGKVRSLPKEA